MACAAPVVKEATVAVANATSTAANVARQQVRGNMEGVGARVIRGPDWKWGKQVNEKKKQIIFIFLILSFKNLIRVYFQYKILSRHFDLKIRGFFFSFVNKIIEKEIL